MNKLLTICILIATSLTVNAQQKPTKSETIASINQILKLSVGKINFTKIDNEKYKTTITNYVLLNDTITFEAKDINIATKEVIQSGQMWFDIPWKDLIDVIEVPKESDWTNPEITTIRANFSTKLEYYFYSDLGESILFDDVKYPKKILFYVVKTKLPALKDALMRLSEIAKEGK